MKYLDFAHITFAHPQFFYLLMLVPVFLFWQLRIKNKKQATLLVSCISGLNKLPATVRIQGRWILTALRLLSFLFIVIALARPQNSRINETVNSEGLDIVLSMDISGSMLAEDFKPNRIEAAKKVAKEFIEDRPTAIGMGLATAVERLRSSKTKTKVIILLTDGVNNTGLIDPITALEIAKAYNIRVYTIGVGTMGTAPYPVKDQFGNIHMQPMPVQIDEPLMQRISRETGGKYFRATDNNSLSKIYREIDHLEKTKIEINSFKRYAELFLPYALLGLLFLFLETTLRFTVFRSLT